MHDRKNDTEDFQVDINNLEMPSLTRSISAAYRDPITHKWTHADPDYVGNGLKTLPTQNEVKARKQAFINAHPDTVIAKRYKRYDPTLFSLNPAIEPETPTMATARSLSPRQTSEKS